MGTADHGDGKIASGMFSNTCGWAPSGSAKYQFILIKKKKKKLVLFPNLSLNR